MCNLLTNAVLFAQCVTERAGAQHLGTRSDRLVHLRPRDGPTTVQPQNRRQMTPAHCDGRRGQRGQLTNGTVRDCIVGGTLYIPRDV